MAPKYPSSDTAPFLPHRRAHLSVPHGRTEPFLSRRRFLHFGAGRRNGSVLSAPGRRAGKIPYRPYFPAALLPRTSGIHPSVILHSAGQCPEIFQRSMALWQSPCRKKAKIYSFWSATLRSIFQKKICPGCSNGFTGQTLPEIPKPADTASAFPLQKPLWKPIKEAFLPLRKKDILSVSALSCEFRPVRTFTDSSYIF